PGQLLIDRSGSKDNSVSEKAPAEVVEHCWPPAISITPSTMSQPYEEVLEGATLPRSAPGERHEQICRRLHREMAVGVNGLATTQLLAPRTQVQVSRNTMLCPDLALVTVASGKLFLAVEIISRDDHQTDTVTKKEIYEQIRVPRLWVVDPRYDNVEIYHSFEFGLKLHGILAGPELLADKLLPQFKLAVSELFAAG
ncbi:MAG TPA: Uma2 family endonuclease, partial [Candidatus Acidoferrales bacterium]|nr:Uma2 family endonuclease [Candidatus Acidoferrales bacterium]